MSMVNTESVAQMIAAELTKQLGPMAQLVGQHLAGTPNKRARPAKKAEAAPKRRGRPPKAKAEASDAPKKKRGRPPKVVVTGAPSSPPKRRGRPPKVRTDVANGAAPVAAPVPTSSEPSADLT